MSAIDERVVSMKFDNGQFKTGVSSTLADLDKLNKGLKLEGATKGLSDVSAAAGKLSLSNLSDSINGLADKFRAFSVIAITALANIATQAVQTGLQFVKSLTLTPLSEGLANYETQINSIQTILANTSATGVKLKDVTATLDQLNQYANQTVYSFADMARNIGTFTAAGVDLKTSTASIKGIANLAALSGSNTQQAATAMYQLSQAIASGSVKLMDWNSVVNAGMGGRVFQEALFNTGKQMKTITGVPMSMTFDQWTKSGNSFRESLQSGWLTAGVLTQTLSQFTGDVTDAQLKSLGYSAEQIKQIQAMAKTAVGAATELKTFTALTAALHDEAATAWASTFNIVFGNIDEAKGVFTSINTVIGGFITASAEARNKVLGDWKALGGRKAVIDGIANAFNALIAIIKPIKDAFREIFPAATGKQLYDLSVTFRDFTARLKIGATTADELKRTFAGVFAVLGIGWDITKEGIKLLAKLFSVVFAGSGGFLKTSASIGDFLVNLRNAIQAGDGLSQFFQALGRVLAVPINIIKTLAGAIATLFGQFDSGKATKGVDGFASALRVVTDVLNAIASGGDKLSGLIDKLSGKIQPVVQRIIGFFQNMGTAIFNSFQGVDWKSVLAVINSALFGGLLLSLTSFIRNLKGKAGGGGLSDIVNIIKDSFGELTNTLQAMQTTLKAATLLQIAGAIALLTVSVVAMSKIDSEGLTRALTAMTVMFTQLFASMAIFARVGGSKGFLKMPLVTSSMILLAVAVDLLTIAVKNLAQLDWNGLAKGLTGLGIILAELVATVQLMPNDAKMVSTSIGLIALAAAIKILVGAVVSLSGLSWSEIAKGLTGVAGILTALTLFTKFADADKAGVLQGAGILLLAAGIKILSSAVIDMASMSWGEIARGLTTLAGSLALIAAALVVIPPTAPLAAAGVLIVAMSMGKVADALGQMGKMSWGDIGKGLTAMLGALTIIAAALFVIPPTAALGAAGVLIVALSLGKVADALTVMSKMNWGQIGKAMVVLGGSLFLIADAVIAMTGSLSGAAAILVVAASLMILLPIIQAFGNMSVGEIAKGLGTLAGVFVILGAAGLLLTPVVPTLLALGVAVALLGVGMLAAGAGVLAFSVALTALSVAGTAGAAAIVAIVSTLAGLIPMIMTQFAKGVIQFAATLAGGAPAFAAAMITILTAILTTINTMAPQIGNTLFMLLSLLISIIVKAQPMMIDAGFKLITGLLNGIANHIGGVVDAATRIITNFLDGISRNLPKIIQSGVNLIISFINGLANGIRNNASRMGDAGGNLASALIEGMIRGLASGAGRVASEAWNVAKRALAAALKALGINSPSKEFMKVGEYSAEGMALGLKQNSVFVERSATDLANTALETMKTSLNSLSGMVKDNVDTTPVITPVLDLTNIKQNAGQIDRVLAGTRTISMDTSTTQANGASAGYNANQAAQQAQSSSGDTFNFTQNNTSPKALSTADIYRQTKNQLSVAKGALTK